MERGAAFGHPRDLYFSASGGIISKVRFARAMIGFNLMPQSIANSGHLLLVGKVVGINAMSLKNSEG